MSIDRYKRKIDYLRISVTDRCNLRCIYCMPEYGILQKAPQEILTFEEIAKIAKLAISCGINKIKITGGEPLIRKDLPQLVQLLSGLAGLKDLSLTTNGILLEKYAKYLKNAGLERLNVSIDTLDEQKFIHITRFGELSDVLRGIDTALSQGFFVKLNVVVMRGLNDDEILSFLEFARKKQIIIRFIELMPTQYENQDFYVSCDSLKEKLKIFGNLEPFTSKNLGNGPARYYKIGGSSIIVGFITPLSCQFCSSCNRLRLTADGLLLPCLMSRGGIDLKGPLRKHKEAEVLGSMKKAIFLKPLKHNLALSTPKQCAMSQIGG